MTKPLVLGVGVNDKSRKAGCGGSGNMTREYSGKVSYNVAMTRKV